jgi:transposase InsO family protein
MTSRSVESRMRGNAHVRFGGARRGNGPRAIRYRASARPYAESVIGLYKTELVHNLGPWTGTEDLEFATMAWVDWWNNRRLLEPIRMIPPVEAEANYYSQNVPAAVAGIV